MRLLFYVVGDHDHGFGHIIRCIRLAHELRARGVECEFLTTEDTPGEKRIVDEFLMAFTGRGEDECAVMLEKLQRAWSYDGLVIDLEHGPSRELLETVRPVYPTVITLGGVGFAVADPDIIGQLADLQIYQSVGPFDQVRGKALTGPEWIIVDPKLADCTPDPNGPIVVARGGGDPHNLTEIAMRKLEGQNLRVICGPARTPISGTIIAPDSLVPYLDGASLYIGALGMTVYEALCAGVPCLVTNWSEDHERTAKVLETLGVINLGQWHEFEDVPLAGLIAPAMLDWRGTSNAGRSLVDGRGGARVAEEICRLSIE